MDDFDFSVFDVEFTDAGIIAPSTGEIKTGWQELFKIIFGSSVNLDDASPQGMLITSLTKVIANKNANFLFFANQFNPANATGTFQDALAELYFLSRKPATSSTVMCECRGLPGTVLNGEDEIEPAQAVSVNGDVFVCVNTVTIPSSGVIITQFKSKETGIIPVNANTINQIYNRVSGWDSVNNPNAGVVGTLIENDLDFENRRKNSIAINANGNKEAVKSAILNLDNITDCVVLENNSSEAITTQGVTLVRNSIYVIVSGSETAIKIAQTIREKASAGCATNGSTEVLLDTDLIPTKFDYVTPVDTYVKVEVEDNELPADYEEQVKTSIINNYTGADGSQKVKIGETLYASRFYTPLNQLSFRTVSIKVSLDQTNWEDLVSFDANEISSITTDNITVENV